MTDKEIRDIQHLVEAAYFASSSAKNLLNEVYDMLENLRAKLPS